jgi:hypothetical protein
MRQTTAARLRFRHRNVSKPRLETLEDRCLLSWNTLGGNAQHTGVSAVASQLYEEIRWQTPVDLMPQYSGNDLLIHYGSPLITANNTVIVPVKTGMTDGFRVEAHRGSDGSLIWSQDATGYVLPSHGWTPEFGPVLTSAGRVYFPGPGGTVYYRDNVDSPNGNTGQLAFYDRSIQGNYDTTIFIDTPITADSAGNIFYGYRVQGTATQNILTGLARISASRVGSWVGVVATTGDSNVNRVPHNSAPALSNDESSLYVVMAASSLSFNRYLVELNSTTLARIAQVALKDPRNGGANNANISDNSSASPMVAPDNTVFYGVLGNPGNGSRGWMLHFSGDLATQYTPGAFGWDNTVAIVPTSAVPSYNGSSTYLIFSKYNNYAGADGGDGVNKVAILDPYDTEVEPHPSSNGLLVMREVMTIAGVTPDPEFRPPNGNFPDAVREWCINAAAVDPATHSVIVNSEDGMNYRWDLNTNTLSEVITLTPGIGEAYTPTVIGVDGTVYAINNATLFAIGARPTLAISNVSMNEGNSGTIAFNFTVTLSNPDSHTVTVNYATSDSTATAGSDYTATSGSLTFTPGGATSQTVTVLVNGDALNEADETFFVNLSGAVNGNITTGQATGTIVNDDPLPGLSINNVTGPEGNATNPTKWRIQGFRVTLSAPSGQTVSVNFATADGTATANSDYVPTSGALTFAPGVTTQMVNVTIVGDTVQEPDETYTVNLSGASNANITRAGGTGTIQNDDGPPGLSIGNVTQSEGNSGTRNFTFNVTLTGSASGTVTVQYTTADGTAMVSDNDYQSASGTLTFLQGQTGKKVVVVVNGDTRVEPNETFFVNLFNAVGAAIINGTGTGTIQNDDHAIISFPKSAPAVVKTLLTPSSGPKFLATEAPTSHQSALAQSSLKDVATKHFAATLTDHETALLETLGDFRKNLI